MVKKLKEKYGDIEKFVKEGIPTKKRNNIYAPDMYAPRKVCGKCVSVWNCYPNIICYG